MIQADLFEAPSPKAIARARRDTGIKRAADHAEHVDPTWIERAIGYVKEYCARHPAPFLAEDVREWSEELGFAKPVDGRAWGAVLQRAAKLRIIKRVGYAPANSSNGSPKCLWRSA